MRTRQRRGTTSKWHWWWSALLVLGGGCHGAPPPASPAPPRPEAPHAPRPEPRWELAAKGLGIRVSNAERTALRPRDPPQVQFLTDDQARIVLSALAAPKPPTKERFAVPERSLPAPRPGRTVSTPFPPASQRARPSVAGGAGSDVGLLTVVRRNPEGQVALAPLLSVTFSHPMVALTSHDQAVGAGVPLELAPQPPGAWRWVGTRTLIFQPEGRFPMATDYQVRVPSGTQAVTNQKPAGEIGWSFATPPPTVIGWRPRLNATHVDLDPLLYVGFDQRIDRDAVLAHLALRARGRDIDLALAEPNEILQDAGVRPLVQGSHADRWLVVRPVQALPKDSEITLAVKQGTPSAEGPLLTTGDQQVSFRTYAPLEVQELQCAWSREDCPPEASWMLELNNDLDLEAFEPAWVSVEPPVEKLQIDAHGRGVAIRGRTAGRRTYRVTVSGELRDVFGQSLGKSVTRTIKVGSAEPQLFWDYRDMVVLDPALPPTLTAYSVNQPALVLQVYRVGPSDWLQFIKYRRSLFSSRRQVTPPGQFLTARTIQPSGQRDDLVAVDVDLSPYLKDGLGQVVVVLKATRGRRHARQPPAVASWVQSTRIGLHAFTDATHAHAWATDLATGAPLEGARISVPPAAAVERSSSNGLARIALPDSKRGAQLVARKGDDIAFLMGAGSLTRRIPADVVRWFVFDDGGLYQPGETVHAKGWVRLAGRGLGGDVKPWPNATRTRVKFRASGPRGNEIAQGRVNLDESGGFHLSFQLPTHVNLGSARLGLELDQPGSPPGLRGYVHTVQVGEYRRPEYEVALSLSDGPHLVGQHAVAMVKASYYTGGGLPQSPVRWKISAHSAHYAPPNWPEYHFGSPRWQPWWLPSSTNQVEPVEWTALSDGDGQHRLRLDFDAVEQAYPRQVQLEAAVRDVNTQEWAATQQLLLHPAAATVGIQSVRRMVKAGEEIPLELIVTDLDGKAVPGLGVSVKSVAPKWEGQGSKRRRTETDVSRCEFKSGSAPHTCRLEAREAGNHEVAAVVRDAAGRSSQSQVSVWVTGQDAHPLPDAESDRARVLADREAYHVGDTAELLVVAPFAPAEGVLTLRRQGVVDLQRFQLSEHAQTLRVKIDPDFLPNVTARVDVVGSVARAGADGKPNSALPQRPAFATGSVELRVPPAQRSLNVGITPKPVHVAPGGRVDIGLTLTDPQGQPVRNGRLALVVVDEALLALAGYELPDPLSVFYAKTSAGVTDLESRLNLAALPPEDRPGGSHSRRVTASEASLTRVEESDTIAFAKPVSRLSAHSSKSGKLGSVSGGGRRVQPQQSAKRNPKRPRSDMSALAAFLPSLKTDAQGRVQASVKLPDSVTRYRVIAVAASGTNHFGRGESTITAKLPLMVRPAPPRFLNYGDRFSLSVIVQNPTPEPLEVDVAVRATNAGLLGAPADQGGGWSGTSAARGTGMAAPGIVEGRRRRPAPKECAASPGQPGHRNRGARPLRHVLRRSGQRSDALGTSRRCRHPGVAHCHRPQERSDPEARPGPAGKPHGGSLAEHPGERVRGVGVGALLPGVRERESELRGSELAGLPVRW